MTQMTTEEMERMAANGQARDKAQAAALGALIRSALSEKSLVWASMLGSVGLWTWAVAHPEPWRLLAALGMTMTVYLPVIWKK